MKTFRTGLSLIVVVILVSTHFEEIGAECHCCGQRGSVGQPIYKTTVGMNSQTTASRILCVLQTTTQPPMRSFVVHDTRPNTRNSVHPGAVPPPTTITRSPQPVEPIFYRSRNGNQPTNLPPPPPFRPQPVITDEDIARSCSTCKPETYATHIYHVNIVHHHYYNGSTSNVELAKPKLN